MVITHCFFEMENYYVVADYRAPPADYRSPQLTTGSQRWHYTSRNSNVNLCRNEKYV